APSLSASNYARAEWRCPRHAFWMAFTGAPFFVFGSNTHLRLRLFLAGCDLFAMRRQIHLGLSGRRKYFILFFLDMVIDVLTENNHLGGIFVIGGRHGLDLRDQVFGT